MRAMLENSLSFNVGDITVSYCIPSYNHACYISDLLDSIVVDSSLLNCNFEIVVLDDGSTDGTEDLLRQYVNDSNLPIKVFFFENAGISENLNRIKTCCKGQWIRLCASDDLVLPGSTSLMLNSVVNNRRVQCVIGDGEVIDSTGNIISKSIVEYHGGCLDSLSNNKIAKSIIMNYAFAGPCLLINSQVYDYFSYDRDSLIDDYFFFVSLILKDEASIKFIRHSVCRYRVHLTNTSKTADLSKRIMNQRSMLYLICKLSRCRKFRFYFFMKNIQTRAKILILSLWALLC